MKEYVKPIAELVSFATEAITSGPNMDTEVGGSTDMDV